MGNPFARIPKDFGKVLFGVWLLLMGLVAMLDVKSPAVPVFLGIVLIASGICFVLGR